MSSIVRKASRLMPGPAGSASLRSLQVTSLLSIVVPLVLFSVLAAFRYSEAVGGAEATVNRSLRVAHEHAAKVLGGAEALQDRLFDQVNGKTPAQLAASRDALHAMLKSRMEGAQLQSIWISGADGKPIASSLFNPPPNVDFSDRAYFRYHRDGPRGRFLSEPFTSRTTGQKVVDLSVRFDGPGGEFGGVINVSLLTSSFEQFYVDVVADEPGLAINLFRQDGPIFARWPIQAEQPARLGAASPVLARVAAGAASGLVRGTSSVDGQDRLIAFRKVGAYPLYAGTGISLTTVRAEVAKEMAIVLALGVPLFGALFFAARMAARRTREAIESAQRLEKETLTRRRAEEALLQAQKLEALGRLTGGVAHDFNNALMVVSNNAYLLRRHVNEAGGRQLDSIGRAVDSATKLTRQLLAFSRRQALVPEHVSLQDMLPTVRELIAPVLGSQVGFTIEVAADTGSIVVDPAELELALLNLSINARDAMPGGGSFSITARNAPAGPLARAGVPAVAIVVSDTGTGIEETALAKVFEPFFTTKPVGQGTGLGLSQVYGFCERTGGTATIDSVVGRGTTVTLLFPAATNAAAAGPAARPRIDRSLDRAVLVVEDNHEVAQALLPLLQALGCRAERVEDGPSALEWLAARDALPDLVLSDVMMPGMDGLELAQVLRKSFPRLPVLLMTGYAERIDAIHEQGFEVLPKPCTPEALSAAIARLTATRAATA